jgi:hypothetical protein
MFLLGVTGVTGVNGDNGEDGLALSLWLKELAPSRPTQYQPPNQVFTEGNKVNKDDWAKKNAGLGKVRTVSGKIHPEKNRIDFTCACFCEARLLRAQRQLNSVIFLGPLFLTDVCVFALDCRKT